MPWRLAKFVRALVYFCLPVSRPRKTYGEVNLKPIHAPGNSSVFSPGCPDGSTSQVFIKVSQGVKLLPSSCIYWSSKSSSQAGYFNMYRKKSSTQPVSAMSLVGISNPGRSLRNFWPQNHLITYLLNQAVWKIPWCFPTVEPFHIYWLKTARKIYYYYFLIYSQPTNKK